MNTQYNILVVDDSQLLLEVLKSLLEPGGYHVVTVDSGLKALEHLNRNNFDLVICDIEMPQMDGLELLERIKNTIAVEIPVILITGHITAEYAMKAIQLGADDFMSKPIDPALFMRSVETQITKKDSINPISKSFQYIADMRLCYAFCPADFLQSSLASLVISQLRLIKEIPASVFNSLIIAVDEMLNNAFIHGTFKLTKEQRAMEHENFVRLVQSLLKNEEIAKQQIFLELEYCQATKEIAISVTDEGAGFAYADLAVSAENMLHSSETGRGIYLLKNALSDELEFANGGRTIKIKKNYLVE